MTRIREFLAIRAGEGPLVALIAALFVAVEAARGLGEIAGDTLFVSRYGADSLPAMYVILGLVSLCVALAYGAALGSLPHRRLLPGVLVGFASLLVLERIAMLSDLTVVLPVVWISAQTISLTLLTFLWSVAGSILNARQAKRLFPLATSAAIAGALVGTLLAGPLARLLGTENLLVVAAAGLGIAAVVTSALLGRFGRPRRATVGSRSLSGEVRAGFDYTRRSPLMRLLAVSYLLFAVLYFAVQFPYLRELRAAFPNEVDLATTLGLVSAAVTLAAFVVALGFTNRVFSRFGVATAALLLPLVYLAGFGVWLVMFTVPTAIAVRFAQQTTQRGISNPAWSAMFNVVPVERRGQVLAFVDGVPGQLGTTLSGILLIVAGAVLAAGQVFIVGFVAAAACTLLVVRMRRRYGDELVASLRAGLGEQVLEGGPGLAALGRNPDVLARLRRELGAPEAGTRRLAAEMLGRLGDRQSHALLVDALGDAEAEVRAAALRALERIGIGDATPDVAATLKDPETAVRVAAVQACTVGGAGVPDRAGRDLAQAAIALADDPDPRVRAELAIALASRGADPATGHEIVRRLLADPAVEARLAGLDAVGRLRAADSEPAIRAALADPEPAIRASAVTALAALVDDGRHVPSIVAALDDEAADVRDAASASLAGRSDAMPAVLAVLETGSGRAQDAALDALARGDDHVAGPVREWSLRKLDRAIELRQRATAVRRLAAEEDGRVVVSTLDFLAFALECRERHVEDRLLTAIGILGAPEATGPIRRSLQARDPDIRGQALEALDAIGDRQLAGSVVELLEADVDRRPAHPAETLETLCGDPDEWIRVLALRASAERVRREWETLEGRIASATGPIASIALEGLLQDGGPPMPKTEQTLGEIERMLFLRRVPLFGRLAPEDLQRLAATAIERLYPAGEALVREGELGDELIVIADGRVRVVHGEGADEQLILTYAAGDHIGELAVLTDRPRAATVIADGVDVRGLVIDGTALRTILRERPDAAMAMLATLAQRLGRS